MKWLLNKKIDAGITLIALVITIIVLLILAGVTVATLTGENGLLSKAQLAKERNIESEQDEKDKLSSYENELDNYGTWERTGGSGTVTLTDQEYEIFKNQSTYSASVGEKVVGTWIDNKPIYRNVFNISENVSSFSGVRYIIKTVANNISDIVDCGGQINLGNYKMNFPSSETDWNKAPAFHGFARIDNSTNNLEIYLLYNSADYSNNPLTGTVWVEYTKKTTNTEPASQD